MADEYLSTAEVAKILRVSTETVRNWVAANRLHAIKTAGGQLRILRSDVGKSLMRVGTK